VHPAIECALQLHAQGVDADQITNIRLETYSVALSFADQPHPQTALQGKFSLQHGVAWPLRHGAFGLDATGPAALADPACAALRERVTLACGPAQEQAYPQSFGARLHLHIANGNHHSSEVLNVLGDPENPLSPEQVKAKAAKLLQASGWDVAQAEQLIGLVGTLPQAKDLGPLWAQLQTGRQYQNVSSAQASESKRSS
jgi:2-methylcitrate dehydratase PrpD